MYGLEAQREAVLAKIKTILDTDGVIPVDVFMEATDLGITFPDMMEELSDGE